LPEREGVTLWLVRHGQTDWNAERRYQGQLDVPLNAAGKAQARALSTQLSRQRFAALYSSDLRRACQTARRIGDALALPVHCDVRLRELHHGCWQGQLYDDIHACYGDDWRHDPHFKPPEGETLAELARRVSSLADELAGRHPGQQVLLVSHGVTLAALICLARRIPIQAAYDHLPANAGAEIVPWPPHG